MLLDKFEAMMKWINNNHRNIEIGKTVLLWLLIVSSLFLTWSLWTYNPSYDPLKKQGAVEGVKIEPTGTRKLRQVVRPIQIIYSQGDKKYFSLTDDAVRNDLYDKLLETIVINLNDIKSGKTNALQDPDSFIEFVFPNNLSQKLIEHIFSLENKGLLLSDIDRMYIFQKNSNDVKKNYLRLISYNKNSYIDLDIQLEYQFFQEKMEEKELSKPYFNYVIRDRDGQVEDVIYLPTERVESSPPIKVVRKIKPEDFKLALFNDPSFVNREENNDKIYYSDDKQYLSISLDTYEMTYRSIVSDIGERVTDFERLKKSVEFVNNHYGWTDEYVLFDEGDMDSKTFRLIIDGIPVLNDLGLIQLRWDKGQIYEYNRSLINLSYEYPRSVIKEKTNEKVDPSKWPSLMSGYEVLELLKQTNKLSSVKDIKIGYSMHKYNNSYSFYEFTPKWFYYNGEYWSQINNELGGKSNGLETN